MGYETEITELVGPSGKSFRVYEDANGNVQAEINGTYTTVGNPLVSAQVDPLTGGVSLSAAGVTISPVQRSAMTTAVIGNSISSQSAFNGAYWSTKSEVQFANMLSGGAMMFKRMTASTRADVFCNYGYSGQKLSTILADLEAQLWTPMQTAGIVPDLIFGIALLENDISAGDSYASMVLRLTQFIRDVQARFPGAILHLCTPRPSFSNNTPAIVSAYQQITAYMMSLDNGSSIFVTKMNGYEDSANPAVPLSGYTDSSVHPNAKGAMVNARAMAVTIFRMGNLFKRPFRRVSNNMALSGSGAASGTNVSGTTPTSYVTAGSANGTYVVVAEQPGVLTTIDANASGAEPPVDLSGSNGGAISLTGVTQISPYAQIQIVSGAENIAFIQLEPRIADGGGNTFQYYLQRQTNDGIPDFMNGDILTFIRPPAIANSGSITALTNYIRAWPKITGGTFAFRVLSQGCEIVA